MAVLYRVIRYEGSEDRLRWQMERSITPGLTYDCGHSTEDPLKISVVDVVSKEFVQRMDVDLAGTLFSQCVPFSQGILTERQFQEAVDLNRIKDPRKHSGRY